MHIHAHLTNPNVASLYAAEAEQKAAAARRAAEVRKKLLLRASELSSGFQIREFSQHKQESQDDSAAEQPERLPVSKKKSQDEALGDSSLSMWA